jgi:hypothetical protein
VVIHKVSHSYDSKPKCQVVVESIFFENVGSKLRRRRENALDTNDRGQRLGSGHPPNAITSIIIIINHQSSIIIFCHLTSSGNSLVSLRILVVYSITATPLISVSLDYRIIQHHPASSSIIQHHRISPLIQNINIRV